jgi:hypothetical protein
VQEQSKSVIGQVAQSMVGQQSRIMDSGRIWLWGFLAVIAVSQLYFVRELLVAFAFFALGFVALAIVVAGLYMLLKSGEVAMARLAALRHPVINMNMATVSTMAVVNTIATVGRENQKAA